MCRAVTKIPFLAERSRACAHPRVRTRRHDAFGELASQTDARGVVTQITSRDALGRTVQRTQAPPVNPPAGTANETLVDTYAYDPTNLATHEIAKGQLGSVVRTRAGTQTWSETYEYDTSVRLSKTTTQHNDGGSNLTLVTTQTYDSLGR